jgi:tetratricopeptide (TPR) repeat protein
MKKIYQSTVIALSLFAFTSCGNDWLDINPADGLPTGNAITNYNDALVARTGMYDGLQGNADNNEYYAAKMFYYGDVSADDMQARTQGMRSSSSYEKRFTLDNAPKIWKIPYNVIRRANRIIEAIDLGKITDAKEAELNELKAEALVVRALVHFDLVKIYAKPYTTDNGVSYGVPIVTSALSTDALLGRNTVAQVYDQVIKDLTDAIELKELSTDLTPGYINEWTAKGLLSRIYLYKGDNQNALSIAQDVITNSGYKLWSNAEYISAWSARNQKSKEEFIFEILNAGSDDWGDRESISYLLNEDGYADAILTKSFLDLLNEDPLDVRHGITLPAMKDEDLMEQFKDAKIFINKFPANSEGEMRLNSLPILRMSEVVLNAAEAAMKLNKTTEAAKYLNEIALRANPAATPATTASVSLEQILKERRKELVGEGHRFFDAMRNNETIVRYVDDKNQGYHYNLEKVSQKFDNTYFRAILPIPVNEVNVNPLLREQQNPGY